MLVPKIYPITDTKLSGVSHLEQVKALLEGGARMIQIRDKNMSSRELSGAIEECNVMVRDYDAKLIVNDC